jgi:hypothetical protein
MVRTIFYIKKINLLKKGVVANDWIWTRGFNQLRKMSHKTCDLIYGWFSKKWLNP